MRRPGGNPKLWSLALAALLAAPAAGAQALGQGQSEPFNLDVGEGRTFTIEVPEGVTHLEVLLEGDRPRVEDSDLFLRFGEPFDPGVNPFAQALYYSIGETSVEHLEVTFASSPPVSPGTWHVLVLNVHEERKTLGATLTVNMESQDEPALQPLELDIAYTNEDGKGFFSGAAYEPQGGNNAANLGDARRAAFKEAVAILTQSFASPVAVTVEARFEDMGGSDTDGAPLASAGPMLVFRDFPGARAPGTWFAGSIVPRLAGTDTCRLTKSIDCKDDPEADVEIRFNSNEDINWWYGFTRSPGVITGGMDFIAVAVHEMLHGLGFVTFANVETGALFSGQDEVPRTDAYISQIVHDTGDGFEQVDQLTDARRLEAFTSGTDLYWGGEFGEAFWDENRIGSGCGQCPKIPLYAPPDPNRGSSVSHVNFPDIMYWRGDAPTSDDDIDIRASGPGLRAGWFMLRDAGWDEDPKPKLGDAMAPRLGMWFDRARNGHGFDLQRAGDTWFLTFFSYGDDGEAEWLLGIGEVAGGVFTGTLDRFSYDSAASPPQDGTQAGDVVIDFTATAASAACDDGTDRSGAAQLAAFDWNIDAESGTWCVEPLIASLEPTTPPDFSGHWWAGDADQGWGLTVYQQGPFLFTVLYFYDDAGRPRWVLGVDDDWSNGTEIAMEQFAGFCRSCQPDGTTEQPAGTLVLELETPTQGEDDGNKATVNVTWEGPEGDTWERDNVTIQLLSDPAG